MDARSQALPGPGGPVRTLACRRSKISSTSASSRAVVELALRGEVLRGSRPSRWPPSARSPRAAAPWSPWHTQPPPAAAQDRLAAQRAGIVGEGLARTIGSAWLDGSRHRLRRRRAARRARGDARAASVELLEKLRPRASPLKDLARRQARRAARVPRRRARVGGLPRYSTREVGERSASPGVPHGACAARTGCRSPTSTPSSAATPTSRRPRSPGSSSRPGSTRSSSSPSCASSAAGWPRRPRPCARRCCSSCSSPASARPSSRGATPSASRLMPMVGPMLELDGPPAPAPVGAYRGDQRRRARGGHAPGRARGRRSASRTSSASRAWASRSHPTSSAAWPSASSSSRASACAATVRLVKTIGDAAMLVGPDATRCSSWPSTSSTPPTPRARTSRSCGSAWPRAPRSAAPATGTGGP